MHNKNSHKNTVVKRERNGYTYVQSQIKAKWIQHNFISLLEKDLKLLAIVENYFE